MILFDILLDFRFAMFLAEWLKLSDYLHIFVRRIISTGSYYSGLLTSVLYSSAIIIVTVKYLKHNYNMFNVYPL